MDFLKSVSALSKQTQETRILLGFQIEEELPVIFLIQHGIPVVESTPRGDCLHLTLICRQQGDMGIILIILIEDGIVFICLIILTPEVFLQMAADNQLNDTIMLEYGIFLILRNRDVGTWRKKRTEQDIGDEFLQSFTDSSIIGLEITREDAEVGMHRLVDMIEHFLLLGCF